MNRFRKSRAFCNSSNLFSTCYGPVLLLLLGPVGCSDTGRALAPVSGKVTLDGKPLAGGSVVCQPLAPPGSVIAGKGSSAFCDDEGRYELETIDGRVGSIVGEHRVRIYGPRSSTTPSGDGGGGRTQEIVPQKYNHNTELTLMVPAEGTTEANFELTSMPPKR